MRIPKINKNIIDDNNTPQTTEEINVETLDRVRHEIEVDPDDKKGFPKFIREIKSICRSSPEYKALVLFLKKHHDMDSSFFFKGVKRTEDKKFSIELHHSTFVMEDICATVIIKRMANGESLKHLDIAHEILWLHYSGMVDLVPLDKTSHALIHSENSPEVFIPIQFVPFGNSHEFYREYKKYIPDNVKAAYSYLQDLSLKYDEIQDIIPNYMKVKHLYYEGFIRLEAFEELLDKIA